MNPLRQETVAPTSHIRAHSRNRPPPPLDMDPIMALM